MDMGALVVRNCPLINLNCSKTKVSKHFDLNRQAQEEEFTLTGFGQSHFTKEKRIHPLTSKPHFKSNELQEPL